MGIKLANNATSRLAAPLAAPDTSISVLPGDGAKFPILEPGDYFMATVVNAAGLLEIVKCTARASDVLTVERAQEGTTPRAFNAGDVIQNRFTGASLEAAVQEGVAVETEPMQQQLDDMQEQLDDANTGLASKLKATGGVATGLKYTVSALGNITGATAIDLATAQEFTGTLTGDVTVSFTNAPAADQSQIIYLRLTNAGAFAITWPADTKFDTATAPTLTADGVDLIGVKYDSVTSTYMVFVIGLNVGVPE